MTIARHLTPVGEVEDDVPASRRVIEDLEAAVIDAAFNLMRWADGDVDLTGLPAEALRLLDKTEALGRAYDPHA